mmetsp:Transcript_11095/g.24007  ORF Transcript_11095/g.24007 Transcript_11095/m.24007 type:complete len:81 (+) Transcript_11095:808-1050(+)
MSFLAQCSGEPLLAALAYLTKEKKKKQVAPLMLQEAEPVPAMEKQPAAELEAQESERRDSCQKVLPEEYRMAMLLAAVPM